MAGIREIFLLIPPVLAGQWAITSPTTSIGAVKIHDSTDATYGDIGWLAPTDGTPWALVELLDSKETTPEPNRVRAAAHVSIFLALDNADTPAIIANFHDLALAWTDTLRQTVAANRQLAPASSAYYPIAGDVRWELLGLKQQESKPLLGHAWRGVEYDTLLTVTVSVAYQF